MELDENLEYHEVTLQEDLDTSRFKDSYFLVTTDDNFEEERILLEEDIYQENVVQTRSQLSRVPQKALKQKNH